MKRQRGRGRRPGGGHNNQPNRQMESNGPDTKVRGSASHIHERYLQLARDAASSGDRVLSENYLQHADHYFRLVRAMQPPPQQQPERNDDADSGEEAEASGAPKEDAEQADADAESREGQDRGDGDSRRRGRNRRPRYRSGDDEGDSSETRAEDSSDDDGEERPRRQRPRRRTNEKPEEGFSDGPKPAFLSSD